MEEAKIVHKFTITTDHAKMKSNLSREEIFTPDFKRSSINKNFPSSHPEHTQFGHNSQTVMLK
jgi:hypothetical protein